ncbi:MAG: hypothetical protein J7M12_03000, partial [Candidatus Hydrogenedentes bacterium]|nr:hypothetical protein [Candidatus Hydrogenedentota bacterium]
RDRMAAIGRLAAGLAHEIRNPVASIRGAIEELKNSLDDPETVQVLAQIAIRESDQLNAIVTGFLDYARGASSEVGPVELRDVIEDVVSLLRRDCGSDHEIELDVPDTIVVTGDYARLKQAFLNIGKNAIEAMDTGGRLTITGRIENNTTAIITVRDTGCGIDADDMGTIFEPFFTTKANGVGMGMAVMHKIVTSHGGDVHIKSTPGKGTEVRITFPVCENPEKQIDTHMEMTLNANAPNPCC